MHQGPNVGRSPYYLRSRLADRTKHRRGSGGDRQIFGPHENGTVDAEVHEPDKVNRSGPNFTGKENQIGMDDGRDFEVW